MIDDKSAYINGKSGDLITAEIWNKMQIEIKKDINSRVGEVNAALEEHKKAPVDASTFAGKDPEEWTDDLDKRYALLNHNHDGVKSYQRYFLELETVDRGRLQPAVIEHKMMRHPIVQVYELLDLKMPAPSPTPAGKSYKFCFCGPEHQPDEPGELFVTKSWDEYHWGDSIVDLIEGIANDLDVKQRKAFKAQFQKNQTLNSWLSNIEKVIFEPGPAQYHFDRGDVYRTQWIRDRANKKVSELDSDGEWPAIFVYHPRLINAKFLPVNDTTSPEKVGIFHLNSNTVEIAPEGLEEMHLMVILRS
jgi:hypothetical protein